MPFCLSCDQPVPYLLTGKALEALDAGCAYCGNTGTVDARPCPVCNG